jgi:hypothetical protein
VAGDLLVSGGTLVDEQGSAAGLTIRGGNLAVEGTGNTVLTPHDALYAWPTDMQSNGTLVPASAADTSLPRWSLADAATQRVKWAWAIPVGWNSLTVRFGWDNESTNAGDVKFQFAYRHIYAFQEGDVNAGAVTTIAIPAITALGQYDSAYSLPTELAGITTPNGFLGDKPFMQCALTRLGSDGTDNLVGAVAVYVATATRAS